MRQACLVVLFAVVLFPAKAAKRSEEGLVQVVVAFDRALEQKDTVRLKELLGTQLRYGHSNGWIETKSELLANLYNGKLTYKSIKLNGKNPSVVIEGKTGLVREEVTVDILYDGKPVNMKLSVLQVWVFRKGTWRLIGRQSTKV